MVVHKSQLFFPPSLQDLYNEQQKQQIIDSIEIDHDTKDPSKKRKMSCMCLTNLQHEHLISVANYLPKTQRALFASALTAPSSSWRSSGWKGKPNAASKAIITSANPDGRGFRWEVLDFDYNNIDESLAAKLTDDDIGALLVCIDAKNTLEMMNMRKLPQVVGYGLEPLMGSKVLGEFNVSRMYYSSFSKEAVVPILDSIISTDGNDLYVFFPSNWGSSCGRRNIPPQHISSFYTTMNQIMLGKKVMCMKCSQLCDGTDNNSCQLCFKRMCSTCLENVDWDYDGLFIIKCDGCNESLCRSCAHSYAICRKCDSAYCASCEKEAGDKLAVWCDNDTDMPCRNGSICIECRVPEEHNGCKTCQSLVFPKLLEEKAALAQANTQLYEQVVELQWKLSQSRASSTSVPSWLRRDA